MFTSHRRIYHAFKSWWTQIIDSTHSFILLGREDKFVPEKGIRAFSENAPQSILQLYILLKTTEVSGCQSNDLRVDYLSPTLTQPNSGKGSTG